MKRWFPIALVAACGAPDPQPVAPDPTEAVVPPAAEVKVEKPVFAGVVTARVSRVVTADFQGDITAVEVTSRRRVRAGDLIAKLDDTELQNEKASLIAQMAGARSDAGAAGATCGQARREADMQGRLYAKGIVSANAFRVAQSNARSQCAAAGAGGHKAAAFKPRIKQIEEQLKNAELKAPIDGVVMVIKSKLGEKVGRGTPIARIYDDRDLIIRFAVPNEHRKLVSEGQRVSLTVEGIDEPIWASVETVVDEEAPINFATVVADIDDNKLHSEQVRVATQGRVRIAEAQQGAKR
jgi:multidrug resistance efflux pump